MGDHLPLRYGLKNPSFDARVWNVPDFQEAFNTLLWRQYDAIRNSVSMAAQSMFSHNELQNKTCNEMQELMFSVHNVNWNDYPDWAKSGTFILRSKEYRKFTTEEIDKLPEKHSARTNPDLMVERTVIKTHYIPRLANMDQFQRFDFIYKGEL